MPGETAADRLRSTGHTLTTYRLGAFVALCAITCIAPSFLSGTLWGVFGALYTFLYICVSEPRPAETPHDDDYQRKLDEVREECIRAEGSAEQSVYKGWMNMLLEEYSPTSFHVNNLQSVLVRLDGKILRISRPNRAILKHAYHTDPSLTESLPRMIAQSMHDLTNATVKLRPRRLARRRWFSRKYPICIKLASTHNRVHMNPYESRARIPEIRGVIQHDYSHHHHPLSSSAQSLRERRSEDDTASGGGASSVGAPDDDAALSHPTSMADVEEVGQEATENMSDADSESSEDAHEGPLARSVSDAALAPHHSPADRATRRSARRGSRSIYLFARTAREKERWFHRLRRACYRFALPDDTAEDEDERTGRRFSLPNDRLLPQSISREYFLYILQQLQFKKNINEVMTTKGTGEHAQLATEHDNVVLMDLGRSKWSEPVESCGRELVLAANLVAVRIFYDFCRDNYWIEAVRNKVQTKLATIHLPYFIDTLELSGFDLGTAIPSIERIYAPFINEWGIWTDFEVNYVGMIKLALETRVNLMRIKEAHDSVDTTSDTSKNADNLSRNTPSRYSDEEIPESPETSPDEDYGSKIKPSDDNKKKKTKGQKLLNVIDKLASTHLFKEASELRPIRKMLEEVSSTRLMLNVEVTQLSGMMTVNLAPPPSDRLWWGFRKPPTMHVHAVPQVGERSVAFSTLSEWIEKKVVNLL